jgi:hypothetical protein
MVNRSRRVIVKAAVVAVVLAVAAMLAAPARAAVVGLQSEGGTGPRSVYQLTNGNFLGLWGFDNRNPNVGAVTLNSAADILSGFRGNTDRIVGFYNGRTVVNAGRSEFDPILWGFTIADEARLSASLWIEWTRGALVFQGPVGGTRNMQPNATLPGDPLAARAAAVTPVPVPGALPLFLAGLGVMGLIARLRRRA